MSSTGLSPAARQRGWSIACVAAVIASLWLADWLRPLGTIGGVEPMRLINIVLTLALASTGAVQWARTSPRFRGVRWLRHGGFVWVHRIAGLLYIPLIVLWDLVFETENTATTESAFVEALNKPLLIGIVITATILFLKWPRPILKHYKVVKWTHITLAVVYVIKFFAEPFLGGKLG